MLTRAPALGMAFSAYQRLYRLAGVDHLHCNGLRNKFWEPDSSVTQSARSCLTGMFGAKTFRDYGPMGFTVQQALDHHAATARPQLL